VIELAYNGFAYHGWQMQKKSISVQQVVEEVLSTLFAHKVATVGCGRTDTGVHASQYFLHFDTRNKIPENFLFRVNQMLPKDIVVYDIFEVRPDFNARFDAISRSYRYKCVLEKDPFNIHTVLHLYRNPDVERMNEAAKLLLEARDFASFCKSGGQNKTTICDVKEAYWIAEVRKIEFVITADRFLRNMVRAVVGTLLDVGYGKTDIAGFAEIMKQKNRSSAGKSVAARGLYLEQVRYNWSEHRTS
jgi:tRNA pseudouridine38-40 synthase